LQKERAVVAVAGITVLLRHDAPKRPFLGDLTVDVEIRLVDADMVAWNCGEAFDVELSEAATSGVVHDPLNVFGGENEDIGPPGFTKVIGEFIDKNLVPCLDNSVDESLARAHFGAGANVKIGDEILRRATDFVGLPLVMCTMVEVENHRKG